MPKPPSRLDIVSLLVLAGAKASIVQVCSKAKDYLEMDALIQIDGVGLPIALAAAQKMHGPSFNPEITLKALSYFDDEDLRTLQLDVKVRLANAVTNVDLDNLPSVDDFDLPAGRDRGLEP